jgi:hypothetical protein
MERNCWYLPQKRNNCYPILNNFGEKEAGNGDVTKVNLKPETRNRKPETRNLKP